MRTFIVLLFLSGCGNYPGPLEAPTYEQKPRQAEAVALVWGVYPMVQASPPPIEWREDRCGDKTKAGVRYRGECYSGLYFPGGRAMIAWRGSYTVSAFAHELLHANQWGRGWEDPNHLSTEWGLVQEANELLVMMGIE